MGSRVKKIYNPTIINVDRVTITNLLKLEFGEVLELNNYPLDLKITITKACEIKKFNNREVLYDLKRFIIRDNGDKNPFREIELDDLDRIKKYVTAIHTARLRREVMYHKLLIEKGVCVGDVIKRVNTTRVGYFLVLPFEETNADRLVVNCQKLDRNKVLTTKKQRIEFRNIRRMKSIKIRK